MIGDGQESEHQNRDIILHSYEGEIQRISEIHPSYTPLHYVLMFPKGEDGWHPYIPICKNFNHHVQDNELSDISDEDNTNNESKKYVSAMNYFAYRLQVGRPNESITL